jgi:exportin-5
VPQAEASGGKKQPYLRKFCLMNSSVVAPLLLFCSHAIRMHDTRCCGVVLRVFRSIVPEFNPTDTNRRDDFPIPEGTAQEIREFISTDVLKAAISSLHDPYFVESQRDLGSLIASILACYCPVTPAPRGVLSSLPKIKQEDIDRTIEYVSRPGLQSRQQRAAVLDLLKDLKGVSISEMGKLSKSLGPRHEGRSKKSSRSKMAQEFMTVAEGAGPNAGGASGRKTPDLEGVAGMFNEG